MPAREVIEAARTRVGSSVRGKWHLDALIGVGGSAAVYAATHRNGKRGALKILRRDLGEDREMRNRFLREGYVANRVGHHGAVAMLDDDLDEDGTPFLVMELLDGQTLERLVRKSKALPLRQVLFIAECVLDVLAAAHGQGVVHGDIKPANVFLTKSGDIKLLDFGIAQLADATRVGRGALGTPAYMSPEQARGEVIDPRADIWALGALMFSLVTGQRPRKGATAGEELVMARSAPMPKCAEVAPFLSHELADVIDRALEFDAAARWPDAATMQQALRLALLLEQAARPADQDLMVPPAQTAPPSDRRGRALPDALRLLKHDGKQSESSVPTRRLALQRPKTPGAKWERVDAPSKPTKPATANAISTPPKGLSTYPPGPTTTNHLAFAATMLDLEPPSGCDADEAAASSTKKRKKKEKREGGLGRVLAAGGLLGIGLSLGLLFVEPMIAGDVHATAGAPVHAGTGADAGAADATVRDASR